MKTSLHKTLLYSYFALTVLILVGVSIGISVLLRQYFIASKQQELVQKGYELGRVVSSYSEGKIDSAQFDRFLNAVDTFLDARVWIVDNSRKIVAISTPRRGSQVMGRIPGHGPGGPDTSGGGRLVHALATEFEPVFSGHVVTRSFYHPIYGENMLIVAVPLEQDDGTVTGAVVLNSPVKGIDEFLQQIYYYIGGTGLVALVVTFFIVRRLARRITNPLKEMELSAAAMAHGDYDARISIETDDEVGKLAKSLNTLAQELARFVSNTGKMEKHRREFVANISHELRTPLTVIRGYTEALLDETITDSGQAEKYHRLMRDETVRLEGLINELLDLSRLQAENTALSMEKIPLAAIAESVAAMLKQRADLNDVALELTVSEGSDIMGNGDRLTQLLLILLDNALKFTPRGGKAKIGVSRTGSHVILTVEDTGTGIPQEDLPYIWERFYKVDKAHTRAWAGTGLGLAIAKEIIDRHGATAEVTSELNQGSTFRIVFPAV